MNVAKLLRNSWVHICFALVLGLVAGSLVTRWHYKRLYEPDAHCNAISYYDKTGKTKLYAEDSCAQ